jgi:hypothetical protein
MPHSKAGQPRECLLMFVGEIVGCRAWRNLESLTGTVGISRATAYRYLAEIERLGVLPIERRIDDAGEPQVRCRLVRARSEAA